MTTVELDPRRDIGTRSSGLSRRRTVEKVVAVLAILSATLACAVLFLVLGSVVLKGVSQIDLAFFTKAKPLFGEKGGIADALIGTALMVGMAVVIAVPIAVLIAIYIAEYAGPGAARFFRLVLDILNGIPAIVVGIFIFGLLVVGHGQSAIYGAISLAMLMRMSCNLASEARLLESAVEAALVVARTADIMEPGTRRVTTSEMGSVVIGELESLAASSDNQAAK